MTTENDPLTATKSELLELEQELTQRLAEMDSTDNRPKMDGAVGRLTFMDEYQQHQMAEHGRRSEDGTRLNSSHVVISYAVFCLKKKKKKERTTDKEDE